jgi:hypothetical protein
VIPSLAISNWTGSTPFCSQSSASSSWIGRDASLTSVSPAQNREKPPPVPDCDTVTRTSRPSLSMNSSAIAWLIGYTVLDPSIWIRPPPSPASPASPPHATTASATSTGIPRFHSRISRLPLP